MVTNLLFLACVAAAASPAPRARAVFTLANTSGHVVKAAYVSPSGTAAWGPNLLGKALKPGARVELTASKGCAKYDVRLVIDRQTEILEDEVEICGTRREMRVGEEALTTVTRGE
jgi:hypothetical protein